MSNAQGYLDVGVSPTKEDVHYAIAAQSPGLFPGAFCKVVEDFAGDNIFCSAIHADGAGTKSTVAYLAYKEGQGLGVFEGIAQDSAVMNFDDLACIGAVDSFLLSNTIGRNAHRIDKDILAALIRGYANFAARLVDHGIGVKLVGGETADVGDLVSTVIVDSTVIARLQRKHVINCRNIKAGHVIVGLSSFGKSAYEEFENSGIGSNGFSRARHLLLDHHYADKFPETYSSTIDPEKVYQGKYRLSDNLPGSTMTIGHALLSPTRTYLPIVRDVLNSHRGQVSGMIHCTGGGLVKSQSFGQGLHYVKDQLFEMPPIFRAMLETGNIPQSEMYQVFNMGHRFEIYCDPAVANDVIAIAGKYEVSAQIVGKVTTHGDGPLNKVTISDGSRTFTY